MILKLDSHPKMSRLAWCGVFLLATAVVPLGARALGNSVSADDAPPSDEIVSQTGDDEIAPASQDAGEEAGPQDATVFNPSFESVLGLAESGGEPDSSREPETAHRARLAGTWRVVDIQVDRKQVPSRFDYYYWQFDADASTIKTAWKGGYLAINTPDDVGYRFVVNPDADPMELTIYGENMLIQAIYRWEGDALKLCFYGRSERDRPSQFPDTDSWRAKPSAPVMEFKLVKDSRPVPPSAAYDTGESSRDVDPAIAQAEQAYRHAARLAERGFVSQAELARTKAEYFQARSNAEYAALQRESQSQLLELDVAEAELKVNAAKSQYESLRRANEQVAGSVTDVEFEKQRFAVELAQIEARRARIKLELYQQQTSVRVSE